LVIVIPSMIAFELPPIPEFYTEPSALGELNQALPSDVLEINILFVTEPTPKLTTTNTTALMLLKLSVFMVRGDVFLVR
ncbi:MAG: hypothetical protein ACKPKO_36530, partial [Candidatus Fonsibacter sp.]